MKIRFGVLTDIHVVQDVSRREAWHNAYDFAGVEARLEVRPSVDGQREVLAAAAKGVGRLGLQEMDGRQNHPTNQCYWHR